MKREPILSTLVAIATVVALAGSAGVAHAADDLATARDLYASAAYEEALTALNRARAAGVPPADAFAVEQYRAFCLLALGRGKEAQSAIENLVVANPLYQPSSTDVSPRVRTAFSDVRRRLLPTIIPQQYAKAKAAFDMKDYATAAAGFTDVINALADPDVAQAAGQPPLSDVKTLAVGFQELSAKAAAPPPPPPPPPAPAVKAEPVAPAPPRIYNSVDPEVMMAEAIRQDVPNFTGRVTTATVGAMEIIINERGLVEQATMRQSISPVYDRQVVDATRGWRFRPATVNGVPVKFRKLIQIAVKPTP
jgi:TonB family protein